MEPAYVQTQKLRKLFKMGNQTVQALVSLDIEVPRGSFTVIMGPSGSGKSTLLYLIGGLDRQTSGTIEIGGVSLGEMDENHLAVYRRKTMGVIFQSFNLISSMTAVQNVAFPMRFSGVPAKERERRARELLRAVGLENRANHHPTEMSGGQQQRVAIARALVNDPQLVLADEPTGNLDTASGLAIMQQLSELHRTGRTLVVVTHDPRMLRFATHILYLLDGQKVSEAEYNAAITLAELPLDEEKS
jgi:putative ABC transport system ATP-binding protein